MNTKAAVNAGGPLPQRPQKNQGGVADKNPDKGLEGPAEKKPRFNQGGPVQNTPNQNQNKGGFANKNNNQGFGNRKNRGGGNQNANKGNFQNQVTTYYLRCILYSLFLEDDHFGGCVIELINLTLKWKNSAGLMLKFSWRMCVCTTKICV